MRTIATLQAPTGGTIRFGDIDVIAEPERLRRTLGYLPQDFGVYPRISAEDMLDHMAVLKGIASKADRRSRQLTTHFDCGVSDHRHGPISVLPQGGNAKQISSLLDLETYHLQEDR